MRKFILISLYFVLGIMALISFALVINEAYGESILNLSLIASLSPLWMILLQLATLIVLLIIAFRIK